MKKIWLSGLLLITLISCDNKSIAVEKGVESDKKNEIMPINSKEHTFGLTADEYRVNLLKQFKSNNITNFEWPSIELQKEEQGQSFMVMISDELGMKGSTDEHDELISITYALSQSEEIEASLAGLINISGMTVQVLNSKISTERAQKNTVELLTKAIESVDETGKSTATIEDQGVIYMMKMDKTKGIWLVFQAA